MRKKVLYIHGYGYNSSSECRTAHILSELLDNRVDFFAPDFPAEPVPALAKANEAATGVDLVVASSYGAFMAMNLMQPVHKLLINPCVFPSRELPLIDELVSENIVNDLKSMEGQLFRNAEAEHDLMYAVFSDNDELFSYKNVWLQHYTNVYDVKGNHRLDYETLKTAVVPLALEILEKMR